jgi:alanine racemase
MLVGGRRVPIVGRVTMDLTMLDLTDLAAETGRVPEPGDRVVLFGRQDAAALPVEDLAAWSETLPYEVLCTIGKRVTRVYLRGGRPWRVVTLVGEMDPNGAPRALSDTRTPPVVLPERNP